MKHFEATVAVAGVLALTTLTTGCGGAAPKPSPSPAAARTPAPSPTPKPSPTPRPPTYTEVLKTFPRDHKVCRTVVYLQEVGNSNILLLSVDPKGSDPFQRGPKDPTIRCVGTRVAVTKDVTLEGKLYKKGARLTVDKANNWIEVRSWD
jgi:hypothetical protein